jgi:hypothetical protein
MTEMPCQCAALREMRAALADRNNLARECADLRDQVADLTAKVKLLYPLATAGREYYAVWESHRAGESDDLDLDIARSALKDAAEAWWDK